MEKRKDYPVNSIGEIKNVGGIQCRGEFKVV